MCRKIAHPTRLGALRQLKAVVWRNVCRRQEGRSRGLTVYRCPICLRWHVGHEEKPDGTEKGAA